MHVVHDSWEAVIADIGARRHGVVTSALAADGGVPRGTWRHQRAVGLLVPVARGVYRLRDHPVTWASTLRALLDVAGAGAVAGGRTAARLHGFWAHRDEGNVTVIVARGRDQRTTLGRIVQTRDLPDSHCTSVDGFPVTTVARTCFDLAGDPESELRTPVGKLIHERRITNIVNDALARRGLTFAAELSVLLAHGKRGRNGTRLIRSLLERFGPDYEPTWSDAESLLVRLVEEVGLPVGEKQVALSGVNGFTGTVDFFHRRQRLVVEVDSTWHDGPLDQAEDRRRDRELRSIGYEVLRVRYGDLVANPGPFLRRLRSALAHREPGVVDVPLTTSTTPSSRGGGRVG